MQTTVNSRLSLVFRTGYTDEGKEIERTRNFQNVITDANNEGLAQAAQAIASLQIHPLARIERNNTYDLPGQ
ncbi:DUF1659 domain-containing protein [Alteribacter natronophilus]|uniref:DUF1659 domain-containing protein n=1 Tax=Alteribacter natronophilus TaxID=2583810 RepID=UPI00110EBE57|nr:DUF1659 domain-containing protein [Alteribacter natronophilus]TMW71528.1 DUF1659 domain-containing protein [Alteribacter natronophilus]